MAAAVRAFAGPARRTSAIPTGTANTNAPVWIQPRQSGCAIVAAPADATSGCSTVVDAPSRLGPPPRHVAGHGSKPATPRTVVSAAVVTAHRGRLRSRY